MTVKKFRKKPVVIEAMQFDGSDESAHEIQDWAESCCSFNDLVKAVACKGEDFMLVHTLEGTMRAQPGDWIIRGVQGEFYPCKPDIFAATYEEAS